jgi:hypothetical protein
LKFLSTGPLLVSEPDDLFGGILHAVGDGEVKIRIAQHALPLRDVRNFEADDDRDLNADVLGGLDALPGGGGSLFVKVSNLVGETTVKNANYGPSSAGDALSMPCVIEMS